MGKATGRVRAYMTWILVVIAIGLAGCDHATKYAAQQGLSPQHSVSGASKTLVPGVLDLVYSENRDTAFSVFRSLGVAAPKALLVVLPVIALAAVGYMAWRRRRDAGKLELAGYAMVLGGALGNVIDRVFRGYVIDFIHVHHWPIFNVADIAVGGGVAALLLASILRPKAPSAPASDPTATGDPAPS